MHVTSLDEYDAYYYYQAVILVVGHWTTSARNMLATQNLSQKEKRINDKIMRIFLVSIECKNIPNLWLTLWQKFQKGEFICEYVIFQYNLNVM